MTPYGAVTIALCFVIMAILCFIGFFPGGMTLGVTFLAALAAMAIGTYFAWADCDDDFEE